MITKKRKNNFSFEVIFQYDNNTFFYKCSGFLIIKEKRFRNEPFFSLISLLIGLWRKWLLKMLFYYFAKIFDINQFLKHLLRGTHMSYRKIITTWIIDHFFVNLFVYSHPLCKKVQVISQKQNKKIWFLKVFWWFLIFSEETFDRVLQVRFQNPQNHKVGY